MKAPGSFAAIAIAVLFLCEGERTDAQRRRLVTGEQAGRMGGYEVVQNWPQPLPDTDASHNGWTWGSGCGAWAETPDKVWPAW